MADIVNGSPKSYKWLKVITIAAMLCGIIARIAIYLQNRNLMLDEANVARNVYERGFKALALPLSYEQYAPPVFLWVVKLCSMLFGFSEQALRLYPLLCGIASVWLLYRVLRSVAAPNFQWYPLVLFSVSPILIRYSSELKQYMPDVAIVLCLLLLAIYTNIRQQKNGRFLLLWFVTGSLAIWSSMPSVFILAGIGCYYGLQCLLAKDHKKLLLVSVVSVLWLLQFGIYYYVILKPQISSSYLQNFHQYDFLFATPSNGGEWMHNWVVFNHLLRQFADDVWSVYFNTALLLAGAFVLMRRNTALALLFGVPIVAVLIAAAFNQFSLMPRVALFTLPLLLVIMAAGLDALLRLKGVAGMIVLMLTMVMVFVSLYHSYSNKRYKYEELTVGLTYLKEKNINSDYFYLHHASGPAYTYYTQIHPGKDNWATLNKADVLTWHTSYDSLAWQMRYIWKNENPVAFLYTNATDAEVEKRQKGLNRYFKIEDAMDRPEVKCYLYDPKP